MAVNTTTTFLGDIKFKDGDSVRLASELATVEEVNTALEGYYTKTECDTKYMLKSDDVTVDMSSYYTKTESDEKYLSKPDEEKSHYCPIPYYTVGVNSSNVLYLIEEDIIKQDTVLRISGYKTNPQNTFTYEAKITINEGENMHTSGPISCSMNDTVTIMMSFVNSESSLVVATGIVITSIEKMVDEPTVLTYDETLYEKLSSNEIGFDGIKGERYRFELTINALGTTFSIDTVLSEENKNISIGGYFMNAIEYLTVGELVLNASAGKYIFSYGINYTLNSVSKVNAVIEKPVIYVHDLGLADKTVYKTVPLMNMNKDSIYASDFQIEVDVEFGDTIQFDGYYGTPNNVFSYEGVLTSVIDEGHECVPLTIDIDETHKLNIIFESTPRYPCMMLLYSDRNCVITSLKRKVTNDTTLITSENIDDCSKGQYYPIPYYLQEVNGTMVHVFDGAFGEHLTLNFKIKESGTELNCEIVLKKDENGQHPLYAGFYDNNLIRNQQIGLIAEHPNESGKLCVFCELAEFQLMSIMRYVTDDIKSYALHAPIYENVLYRTAGSQLLINARVGDVIHLKGSRPNDSTFDSYVKIGTSNTTSILTSGDILEIRIERMTGEYSGKILLEANNCMFDVAERVYANVIDRIAQLETKLAQLMS